MAFDIMSTLTHTHTHTHTHMHINVITFSRGHANRGWVCIYYTNTEDTQCKFVYILSEDKNSGTTDVYIIVHSLQLGRSYSPRSCLLAVTMRYKHFDSWQYIAILVDHPPRKVCFGFVRLTAFTYPHSVYTQTHTHTHTHACMHTIRHQHTHTHTHTHTHLHMYK